MRRLVGCALVLVWLGCGGGSEEFEPDSGMDDEVDSSPLGPPRIVISEVVTAPLSDWNRSDGDADPFSGKPGAGLVATDDEFIEIFNAGDHAVDLSGWTLEIIDDSSIEGPVGAIGDFIPGQGSRLDALRPGSYAVIGNPQGTISNDVYIVIRDPDGKVIDDVEIGGFSPSRDMEGDGVGDGAPESDINGFARGIFEEAVARPQNQPDTDVDVDDFVKMYATPLGPNVPPPRPTETTAPQVMGVPPDIGSHPVTELMRISYSETIDALSMINNIIVTADGRDIPVGYLSFEDSDSTMIINPIGHLPYGARVRVVLEGGNGGITDLAGNYLAGDFSFEFTTEAAPSDPAAVLINEVCVSPRQDWNNSAGGDGVPFSDVPGSGKVNSEDEWVELLVTAPGPIDLSQYSLVLYNGPNFFTPTREDTSLSAASPKFRVVGSGTMEAAVAGDRIIIGNPRGAFLPDTYVELRDQSGALVDVLEIGGNTLDSDRGGDGVMNGAPEPGRNGNSTGINDETIARIPDGQDSGNDVGDFAFASGTPGIANQASVE